MVFFFNSKYLHVLEWKTRGSKAKWFKPSLRQLETMKAPVLSKLASKVIFKTIITSFIFLAIANLKKFKVNNDEIKLYDK